MFQWNFNTDQVIQSILSDTFILKTYSKDSEAQYKQEIDGFRSVRRAESIINFYGSFIHGDEYNILLEYPDKGTLEDFFSLETPPSRGPEIIKFWECLFSLINGLKAIHSSRSWVNYSRSVYMILTPFYRGHHSISPDAIVVISNGAGNLSDWKFKLANVGIDSVSKEDRSNEATTYGGKYLLVFCSIIDSSFL